MIAQQYQEKASRGHISVVTPSFSRDYALCRDLNDSILTHFPASTVHFVVVDRSDLPLFASIAGERTVVVAVEDVLPRGFAKVPFSKKWWFSRSAMLPARGWLIQQLVKLAMPEYLGDGVIVNVDSDVRFVRAVDERIFIHDGKTRLYRKPGGIVEGMDHVKWHRTVARLLDVRPETVPMNDYVGNMISWNRRLALAMRTRVEAVTGLPWHVALVRARTVSEYLTYGLFVDKHVGADAAGVWIDERSWCHTHWGPGRLSEQSYAAFVDAMPDDDVAFSIAGYTGTDPAILRKATDRAIALAHAQVC